MFHSKHTQQDPYLLNLFSTWIFCRFLKFPKNAASPYTIVCNCLHERRFELHTSFRLETGSAKKISLSFWFVAASRKNRSILAWKAIALKQNWAIFINSWSVLWYCKFHIILPIYRVPSFYNKLHLADALFARTRTNFCMGQTVYSSFINRNVSTTKILLTCFILFPISYCKRRNLVKAFKFST